MVARTAKLLTALACLLPGLNVPPAVAADSQPTEPQMCAGMMAAMATLIGTNLATLRDSGKGLSNPNYERAYGLANSLITSAVQLAPDTADNSKIGAPALTFGNLVLGAFKQENSGKLTYSDNSSLPRLTGDLTTCGKRFGKTFDLNAIDQTGVFPKR